MSSAIKTIDLGHGITGRVFYDDHGCDGPHEWGNDAILMAVLHRHYINPAPECGDSPEELEAWRRAHAKEYDAFPLFMYDHSGTIYRPSQGGNPFSCAWDSGRVGYVFVKKAEFKRRVAARYEAAKSFCEEYTSWANGEIYGFTLTDSEGKELDSCWGFIGDIKFCIDEMKASAAHFVKERIELAARCTEASRPDLYGTAQ